MAASSSNPLFLDSFSRRTVVKGLAGLMSLTVAGADLSACTSTSQTPTPSSSTPTPTPTIQYQSPGSTFYVYRDHKDVVHDVAWSPDGWWVASASGSLTIGVNSVDNAVHVWNPLTGNNKLIYKGHAMGILALAWSR
ncbi:MAG TPA: hypothetical protein VFA41_01075 [Ktedonobacteraceae bacterium]|jgi:WD40 repeat protein|nr:hypothetical protein [Ktedonobacteraceae bacterium]